MKPEPKTLMNRLTICLLLLATSVLHASPRPAKESDEDRFVRLTRQLEEAPLDDRDKSIRAWLLKWAIESKDIVVIACPILGPVPGDDIPYSAELLVQGLYGNAAFQILHPDRRNDPNATQIAGVRSAVAAYASILAKEPDARIPYFDELLEKERAGTLEAFLTPIIAEKCTGSAASGE